MKFVIKFEYDYLMNLFMIEYNDNYKRMDKEILRLGLQLYYNILKLHRRKLPGKMR